MSNNKLNVKQQNKNLNSSANSRKNSNRPVPPINTHQLVYPNIKFEKSARSHYHHPEFQTTNNHEINPDITYNNSHGKNSNLDHSDQNYEDFYNYCAHDFNLKNIFSDDEISNLFREMTNGKQNKNDPGLVPRYSLAAKRGENTIQTNSPNKSINGESNEDGSYNLDKSRSRGKPDFKKAIQSAVLGRNQFIIRLLKYTSNKFESLKEKTLAKAFNWLAREINDILVVKSDQEVYRILQKSKLMYNSNDKEALMIGNYLKHFSQLNNEVIDIHTHKPENMTSRTNSINTSSFSTSRRLVNQRLSSDSIKKTNPNPSSFNAHNDKYGRKSFEVDFNESPIETNQFHRLSKSFKQNKGRQLTKKQEKYYLQKLYQEKENNYNLSNKDIKLNEFDSDDSFVDFNNETGLGYNSSINIINNPYIFNTPTSPNYEIISYNENHLTQIETVDFDVFLLEKEVGQKNILPAIAVYIFQQNNYYSKIDHEKFENFIYEIVNGYDRNNPYHHVNNIFLYYEF
jgi:hypothetical protein